MSIPHTMTDLIVKPWQVHLHLRLTATNCWTQFKLPPMPWAFHVKITNKKFSLQLYQEGLQQLRVCISDLAGSIWEIWPGSGAPDGKWFRTVCWWFIGFIEDLSMFDLEYPSCTNGPSEQGNDLPLAIQLCWSSGLKLPDAIRQCSSDG